MVPASCESSSSSDLITAQRCPAASRQPGTALCLLRELFCPGAWQLGPSEDHNTRPQRTPAEGNSQKTPPVPGNRQNCQKHGGTAPDQGHYTRSEEVHCLRIGCSTPTHKNKRGTGKPSHSWPTTSPGARRRASNDDPVSVGSVPSPRPRYPRYRSECPVRRCDRLRCRRPGPYQ